MIVGNGVTREVFINGKYLSPKKSQKVYNHSPDGFSWGYGGSGPAQLALAILLEVTWEENAVRLYQEFKRDLIARLPQSDFALEIRRVEEWILSYMKLKEGGVRDGCVHPADPAGKRELEMPRALAKEASEL